MTHVATGSFHSPKAATTFICHGLHHKTRMEVLWSLLSPPSITSHEASKECAGAAACTRSCSAAPVLVVASAPSTPPPPRMSVVNLSELKVVVYTIAPPDLDPAHWVRLPEHHLAACRPPTGGVTAVSSAPGGGTGVAG
eukprot:CAMPEP_0206175970 /NCGR_PEP_ID=MMETSP1474-20131121/56740_1 /ASSEMBLY_ACC=CAM_ASM_001110 /TAXON_ID=97495 /ORGANISM="Imantonia sp., Strain RCC918" /LENGTH=138 /DNA_ID=CAMNT_0053586657 /DNA_START=205 /DNA_END=617 /DNA_ORIENTATION=-